MKKIASPSKLKLGVIVAAMTALVGVGFLRYVSAAGQLKLSSSGSVQNGSNITVAVRIDPGEPVFGVEAYVNYDQSKLQFVSISPNTQAFSLEVVQSAQNGTVSIARGSLTGVQGDILIANITFKALAGSGNTALQITGNAVSETAEINPGFVNTTIALTTPSTSSPPSSGSGGDSGGGGSGSQPSGGSGGSGGSSGGSSGSGGTGSSGGSGDSGNSGSGEQTEEQKDIGLEVQEKRIGYTKVTLKATTKKKAKVYIAYGTAENQLVVSTSPTGFGTEHEIDLNPAIVIPGTRFYYKAIAEDERGTKVETDVKSFKAKGFRVRLRIAGSNERPCKRCKITFRSDPVVAETDENGYVTFEDVAPGNHTVEYEQDGQVHAEQVTVAGDEPLETDSDGVQQAEPEEIQVVFKNVQFAESGQSPIILPATIATVLALLAAAALLLYKRRQNRFNPVAGSTSVASSPQSTSPESISGQVDELINKVKEPDQPDPGSVVKPKDNKDER